MFKAKAMFEIWCKKLNVYFLLSGIMSRKVNKYIKSSLSHFYNHKIYIYISIIIINISSVHRNHLSLNMKREYIGFVD